MPFLTNAGTNLRYDRAGTGPTVLLVHGWTGNRTFWDAQVQALRDRFTLITVDLRGHGESSHPQKGYTVGTMVGDLEALVRALRVPRIAVVGWSMGGMLALALAQRLGERMSALGLVSTSAGGFLDAKNPNAIEKKQAEEMRSGVTKDFREFARGFAARLFKDGTAAPLYGWAVREIQKTPPHVAAACLEAMLGFDVRKQLAKLSVPTTVLHGRHDELLPLAHGEYLAKHIKGAKLRVFEGSGHSPHLEEPEAFNAALAEMLAG